MDEKKVMWGCVITGIIAAIISIGIFMVWKDVWLGKFLFTITIICCMMFIYLVAKSQNIFWKYMRKIGWEQFKGTIILMGVTIAIVSIIHYYPLVTNEPTPKDYEIKSLWGVLTLLFIPLILMNIKIAYRTRNRFFVSASAIQLIAISGIILFILGFFENISIVLFMCMMLLGGIFLIPMRMKKGYNVHPFGLYRNIVVKEGEKIDERLDGYSQRPYSRKINIPVNDFKDIAEKFAQELGKEFTIFDYDIKENSAVYFPSTNVMDLAIYTYWMASIDFLFNKKRFTRVKIAGGGNITVFISKNDYERILEPVTYHTLCKNISEKFEQSFLEFAKGNKDNSIKILRGDENE